MDALFNQHFSIGSNYPNPSGLMAPSPPPPQPVNLQSKTNHEFPQTGGNFTILLVIYAIAGLRSSLKPPKLFQYKSSVILHISFLHAVLF